MTTTNVCTRCVMDTSDPDISFDREGVCNHCHRAVSLLASVRFTEEESQRRLRHIAASIKARAGRNEYDCIIGLSGGADSSYAAYVAKQIGLRPLAVHFDNGWNSEVAVSNIKSIVTTLNYDLITYVIDWEEFRDLQRAFLKASVLDIEMLTDHAIMAAMFSIAKKYKIRYVLSGQNLATEHEMPKKWMWPKQDLMNLRAIHKRFGGKQLHSFPTLSSWRYLILRRYVYKYVELLNNLNYKKLLAINVLKEKCGWQDYGGKHCESLFTKFYQHYILPAKFGIDKRRAHLSALIRNGEISREDALRKLSEPPYDPEELRQDKEYVLKKLGFTEREFDGLMEEKPVPHSHYGSDRQVVFTLLALYRFFRKLGLLKSRDHGI